MEGLRHEAASRRSKTFEAEIAELIRTGKMLTLAAFLKAVEETRQKYTPLILAARRGRN